MNDESLVQMEKQCAIVESIAQNYPPDSPERAALRRCAFALIFAIYKHEQEFVAFVKEMQSPLSPEQVQKLNEIMGQDEDLGR